MIKLIDYCDGCHTPLPEGWHTRVYDTDPPDTEEECPNCGALAENLGTFTWWCTDCEAECPNEVCPTCGDEEE